MKCREIMNHHVIRTEGSDSVAEAAFMMRESRVGMLAVCDRDNRPIGILTDRDITIRVCAAGLDPNKVQVQEVMTRKIIVCDEDADLLELEDTMITHQVERMLLVDSDGRLAGVITLVDILHHDNPVRAASVAQRVTRREFRHRSSSGAPSV